MKHNNSWQGRTLQQVEDSIDITVACSMFIVVLAAGIAVFTIIKHLIG